MGHSTTMVTTTLLLLSLPVLAGCVHQLQPRIISGDKATDAQFPYTVRFRKISKNQDFCTGSIVDIQWILTAAHCFKKNSTRAKTPEEIEVHVGSIFRDDPWSKHPITRIYVHPEYISQNADDIALVKLATPLTLSQAIQLVPLGVLHGGDLVVEAGWGRVNPFLYPKGETLRYVNLQVMETEQCQKIHNQFGNVVDGEKQICAYHPDGGKGARPCFGDSGGPLVDVKTGRLVGVFSGMEDCSGRYPSLFMKVAAYVEWIEKVTKLKFDLA